MADWGRSVVAFFFSALGMLAGHWVGTTGAPPARPPTTALAAGEALSVPSFTLVDAEGRQRILVATSREGSPAMWFFDRNGKARLNLGLYGDDNAFIVLNDDQERAVEILRTRGPKSAPFLVLKAEGRDRIVMGLGGAAMDPFLHYYDVDGTRRTVFGSAMP